MHRLGKILLLGSLVAAAGCASVVPGSETVTLTRDESAVVGCKEIGHVQTWISYSFRDADNQLRNRAFRSGGNVVLVTSSFGDSAGMAYHCGPVPAPAAGH